MLKFQKNVKNLINLLILFMIHNSRNRYNIENYFDLNYLLKTITQNIIH